MQLSHCDDSGLRGKNRYREIEEVNFLENYLF